MKLDIREIPAEGTRVELSVDEETVNEVVGGGADGGGGLQFSLATPLKARLAIEVAGSMVVVRGNLNATLSLDCSRCLRVFDYLADPSFTLYFVKDAVKDANDEKRGGREGGDAEPERELMKEDLVCSGLPGFVLDTAEIVIEQFALNIPTQPVCRAVCKGLCVKCGRDLNTGPCGCIEEEKVDPRLECLKGFKV